MKQQIQVRFICGERSNILRKLYVDQVGNFNRVACRYAGKTYIVHSEAGDLGDPFRADATYLDCLYIKTWEPCEWNL
jgi:hypothetical protein